MKKLWLLLLMPLLLCGCGTKEIDCIYKDETNADMKSYTRVTLETDGDTITKERLYAVYVFKNADAASKNYSKIEAIINQDTTVKLEQVEERIRATGTKDVSKDKYDKKAKIAYYEQLGYTCK
jgi:esterase/lipase superfamily enzyme